MNIETKECLNKTCTTPGMECCQASGIDKTGETYSICAAVKKTNESIKKLIQKMEETTTSNTVLCFSPYLQSKALALSFVFIFSLS